MKVLIIGQGGREHALAWKVSQSPQVHQVFVIPGNDGMKDVATPINISGDDFNAIISFAKSESIDLTIIGNEQPLVDGLVDLMHHEGLNVFGPTQKAAQIEGSKSFAKALMKTYGIPTADYLLITNLEDAINYLRNTSYPVVIKVDGLAAGKGVVISNSYEEAVLTTKNFLKTNKHIVFESFLEGIEFSLIALVHEEKVYPFELAQDYKRAYDDHQGPNTGGMGCYSPVPTIPKKAIDEAMQYIMFPVAQALKNEGCPFTGFLYGGLMLTNEGVKVIEFNARFGDPEAEVILPRLESDLVQEIMNLLEDKVVTLKFKTEAAVGVVVASKGYPESYDKGHIIDIPNHQDVHTFHMGTKYKGKHFLTNGGRLYINVALGQTIESARSKSYESLKNVDQAHVFYRNDIGKLKL